MHRVSSSEVVPVLLGDDLPPFRRTPLTPKQERDIMSDVLYLLVAELEPLFAPKITGMILEMDEDRILDLIGSPETLKEVVKEATKVLADWIPQQLKLVKQEAACKFLASILPAAKL